MAVPSEYWTLASNWRTCYLNLFNYCSSLSTNLGLAAIDIRDQNWAHAYGHLLDASGDAYYMAYTFANGSVNIYTRMYSMLSWIGTNWSKYYDMTGLLETMMLAKFEELKKFIGIEDAYRCALWDAPFEAEYYAFLARTFKMW